MRVVSQPAFLEQVVEEASRYPSFSFERGTRVRDLIRDGGRMVEAELETEGGLREAWADLVVGCGGRGSLVRTRGPRAGAVARELRRALVQAPGPRDLHERVSLMILVATKKHPAICYTSWDGRLQYELVMPKGGLRELREKDWVSESVGSAPAWLAEHVVTKRDEIESPAKAQRVRRPLSEVDHSGYITVLRGRRAPDVPGPRPGDRPRAAGCNSSC